MYDDYTVCFGAGFDKKFKKAHKKHRRCFEEDFDNVKRSILTAFEQTRHTKRIGNLGKKYCGIEVFKTRMAVRELRGMHARVIWHPRHKKKDVLFIDVYLKNMQTNHDENLIKSTLDEYYSGAVA